MKCPVCGNKMKEVETEEHNYECWNCKMGWLIVYVTDLEE